MPKGMLPMPALQSVPKGMHPLPPLWHVPREVTASVSPKRCSCCHHVPKGKSLLPALWCVPREMHPLLVCPLRDARAASPALCLSPNGCPCCIPKGCQPHAVSPVDCTRRQPYNVSPKQGPQLIPHSWLTPKRTCPRCQPRQRVTTAGYRVPKPWRGPLGCAVWRPPGRS